MKFENEDQRAAWARFLQSEQAAHLREYCRTQETAVGESCLRSGVDQRRADELRGMVAAYRDVIRVLGKGETQ